MESLTTMGVLDVLTPVLMIIGAIVAVAALYFGFTALKDRSARKREDNLRR